MSLSPQWLDELRQRITLSDLIGRTISIQKAGREYKACCPFHGERTPSFTINNEKGFYHCFGCGAHGDAIRWMTDQRGLAFMDAVRELAQEAGMEVPAPDPLQARKAKERASLYDVMAAAQSWFASNLASDEGSIARAYLAKRGIDRKAIAEFGFGYAPRDRQALKKALSNFPDSMLIDAGLRITVDGREPYDRFRGRLMLPIEDARGRVIAFGGRILDPQARDAPKYLNSPDTPLFDKGSTLYNLHRAAPAARKSGQLVIVEGYMDVVALASHGLAETVAPLGTALTERQIQLLWRQAEQPVLCFDGDNAGQLAAMRAISRALPLLKPGYTLKILHLPSGIDPDDFIRANGAKAMIALISSAQTMVGAIWQHELSVSPLDTPEAKAGLKSRLLSHVETITDPDIRALYRRELLDLFSSFAFPRRQSWQPSGNRKSPVTGPGPSADHTRRLRHRASGGALDSLASAVLTGLTLHPKFMTNHQEQIASLARTDSRFAALLDALDHNETVESEEINAILGDQGLETLDMTGYAGPKFGFLVPDTPVQIATAELEQAIALLVERPALDTALKEATRRFERENTDEAFAQQQYLLKRKLEFDERLRQMAGKTPGISG